MPRQYVIETTKLYRLMVQIWTSKCLFGLDFWPKAMVVPAQITPPDTRVLADIIGASVERLVERYFGQRT
jgi:hypothetical protein